MNNLNFKITNITCEACVKVSMMVLRKIPGVTDIQIDQQTGSTTVSVDHDAKEEIINALKAVDKEVVF